MKMRTSRFDSPHSVGFLETFSKIPSIPQIYDCTASSRIGIVVKLSNLEKDGKNVRWRRLLDDYDSDVPKRRF